MAYICPYCGEGQPLSRIAGFKTDRNVVRFKEGKPDP